MKIRLLIVLLLSFHTSIVWAVACDAIFTNGVQSHSPGGQVQLGYQVEIGGGSNVLSTATLNMQSPPGQATCGGSLCTASGTPAASSNPVFVSGNGGGGAVNITATGNHNLDAGDYTSVTVNNFRLLTFSDANSIYLMKSLNTGYQSQLRFRTGDYWIDGNMTIGQETELRRQGGGGTVRIFVNGNVQLNYQVFTNGFAPGELLIYATGNITLAQEVEVSGFFYAGGTMQVGYQAEVNGAVSGSSVQVAQWAEINYDGGALVAPDFTPFCGSADAVAYYMLSHSTNGITCEAEPVTVTAYNAEGAVVAPAAGTVLTLSTTSGTWVGGNTYNFNGSETAFTRYLRQTSLATLTLNASDGTASASQTQITFTDTALRFYGNIDLDPIPNQVAGVTDLNPVLRIIRTDDETGACVARVQNRSLDVNLAFECQNPSSCIAGQTLSLNGVAVEPNNEGDAINYQAVELSFDATGFADMPLLYSDVGQVRLHGQINLPAEGNDPAISIIDNSNPFVVVPHRLEITSVPGNPGGGKPPTESCEATDGFGFLSAGSPFVVRVSVLNEEGNLTPNFGMENSPEEIILSVADVAYPSYPNRALGALDVGAEDPMRIEGGLFEFSEVAWSEVGSMRLSASISGDRYLGIGVPTDDSFSPPSEEIGRFFVDHFVLDASVPEEVENSCGGEDGFTYMDQPQITISYTLLAMNALGDRVRNYHVQPSDAGQSYDDMHGWLCAASIYYHAKNNDDLEDVGNRLEVALFDWGEGEMRVDDPEALFRRGDSPDIFRDLQLGISVDGDFDSAQLIDKDMMLGEDVSASAMALGAPLEVRYGRLNLASAYGPEALDLPVPFTTDYFNGVRWQRNTLDNCTTISRSDINYPNGSIDNDANRTVILDGGTTTGQYSDSSHPADISFTSGQVDHFFSASGVPGSFVVTIDLEDYPWLQFNWGGAYPDDVPVNTLWGEYHFDSYHGHDRIIYWREVFD